MRNFLFLALAVSIVCLSTALFAESPVAQGQVSETEISIESKILGETMNVSVYVPPNFKGFTRKYPVLYLLHGYSDDHTGWVQFGDVARIADEAIMSGKAAPMIIVMPDAKKTFYMNRADGSYQYEDYFFQELIPFVEKTLPCRTGKEFRAVAGLSMGGYGSLLYALKHPDMFASACPLSAAVWFDDELAAMPLDKFNDRFKDLLGVVNEGDNRLTDHWKANSIEHLMLKHVAERDRLTKITQSKEATTDEKKAAGDALRALNLRLYIDCGDDDFLVNGNVKLLMLMRDKKVPYEFRVRDGGHTWGYWRSALPEVLEFVSQTFHR